MVRYPVKIADSSGPIARRRAYTLLELVIVLSVIGLLASLSWPMLMRPWSKSRVQRAAQDLSRELLRTRLGAIEKGQVFQLRWRPGTGQFEILPWDPPQPENLLLSTDTGFSDPGSASPMPISETESISAQNEGSPSIAGAPRSQEGSSESSSPHALPDGITFLDPNEPLDPAPGSASVLSANESIGERASPTERPGIDEDAEDSLLTSDSTTTPWAPPIWFYPDGRTTNARWMLVGEDGYQIEVILRGWVGTVRVGPVRQIETLDTETANGQPDTVPADRSERTPRS